MPSMPQMPEGEEGTTEGGISNGHGYFPGFGGGQNSQGNSPKENQSQNQQDQQGQSSQESGGSSDAATGLDAIPEGGTMMLAISGIVMAVGLILALIL